MGNHENGQGGWEADWKSRAQLTTAKLEKWS